ncbi:MAG TPA: hypothetical protein VFX65_11240, partial [Candidatus Limnocylindrales bacterium]|nr:hypothetical protein [Candidatus Limnocylindrales bacterium]
RPVEASDPHVLGPDMLPTPFTADEIRRGCPDGRLIRLLVEVDGQETVLRTNRFVGGDDEGSTIESQRLALDGRPLGRVDAARTTWRELQAHASFPVATTTRTAETIETPLGTNECLRYTRTDGTRVSTFWFAKALPGMPIRYQAEESGRVVSQVTMLGSSVPSDPPTARDGR